MTPAQPTLSGTLFWADSELRAVRADGRDLCLHFAAAQFRPGPPGAPARPGAAASGWLRGLVLRLHGARWPADAPLHEALGRIAEGRLDGAAAATTLPLPARLHGPLRLTLALANGTPLVVAADGLSTAFDGAPGWHESLAC